MAKQLPAGSPVHRAKPHMRRSTHVRVSLASIVAMAGGLGLMAWMTAQPSREHRPLYASKEDCEREWSDHDCEPQSRGTGGSGHGGGYYRGPIVRGYTVDDQGKAHPTDVESDRVPSHSRALQVQRGGFGRAGGRYGAGS